MRRVNFFKFFDRLHTLADRRDVFIKLRKKTFESIKRRVLRSLIFLYFIFVISSKDIKFIINSYLQDDTLLLSWPFGIDALLFPLLTFTALLFLIHLITFILEPFTGLECARRLNRMTNGAFGKLLSQR